MNMLAELKNRCLRRLKQVSLRTGPELREINFLGCRMMVRAREDVGRSMILGEFEATDLSHFMGAVRDGDLVFDIGANVGAYCIPVARAFPSARVIAFEPIPLNAALIDVSRLLNGTPNVEVVRRCVSDRTGTVEFSLASDSAYSSMIDTRRKSVVETFRCEATSLDDHCRQSGMRAPDIVKIDVEGAELKVLQGAAACFAAGARRPRLALIELYDQNLGAFGTSIDAVTALMTAWGYRPYVLIDGRKETFARSHQNVHYNVFFEA